MLLLSGSDLLDDAKDHRVGTQSVLAEGPRATKGTIGLGVNDLLGRIFRLKRKAFTSSC